ncbi:hypothetical protein [Flavobacterium selenitireducens]|uniref:hypothetical protein n=1 Tax=Flavobacterium selenitireducens TaxID=2722704 RepID=UPI00168B4CDF|nr:hypothetical protein [Flavobacterium selenitireducens]MBD3584047.1 hypothetical protein [Flavobacterium selenitireducens]
MNKKIKISLIILSILIFLISLVQECYLANGSKTIGSLGLMAFLIGWMNASDSFIVWFANPLYLLSVIFLIINKNIAKYLGGLSLLLSLSFLILDEVLINEGGNIAKIQKYLIGYWLWVLSMFLIFLCTLLNKATSANRR